MPSDLTFYATLSDDFAAMAEHRVRANIRGRWSWAQTTRMCRQILFVDDEKRMDDAQQVLTRTLTPEDMQNHINAHIREYNKFVPAAKRLHYVSFAPYKPHEIVDDAVFGRIRHIEHRETLSLLTHLLIVLVLLLSLRFAYPALARRGGRHKRWAVVLLVFTGLTIVLVPFLHNKQTDDQVVRRTVRNVLRYTRQQQVERQMHATVTPPARTDN